MKKIQSPGKDEETKTLNKDGTVKQSVYSKAQETKRILDSVFYDNLIMISSYFKEQMFAVTQKIWDAKIHTWDNKEKIEGFFTSLRGLYDQKLSLSRIVHMLVQVVSSYKPKVTWLDEIAEALNNIATGLNHFMAMIEN